MEVEMFSVEREDEVKFMLLYHGSNVVIKEPKLLNQTRGLDFGPGFYLTTSEKQAANFSKIVFNRTKTGSSMVNVYEYNNTTAEKMLFIKKFEKAETEWLRFVAENRLKTYQGIQYDMVIGPVANDTVMPAIQAYLNGLINEEATLITLKTSKLVDQMCFKTEKTFSFLKFINAYDIMNKSHANE